MTVRRRWLPGVGVPTFREQDIDRVPTNWRSVMAPLGPVAESQLRRALSISLGDPLVLVQSPLSATLLAIALVALAAPLVLRRLGRFKAAAD